jgi:hypothetical protein
LKDWQNVTMKRYLTRTHQGQTEDWATDGRAVIVASSKRRNIGPPAERTRDEGTN